MTPDCDLLRRYAQNGDETAFRELVQRHLPVVYGAALRLTGGDAHAAQDVAQAVFTALAYRAAALTDHTTLAGWLHTTTRNLAHKQLRSERRRRAREKEAATMQQTNTGTEVDTESLNPLLDEAVGQLREDDRNALLLRYYHGKSHQEVAATLGLSENTANKRIERALEKLRGHFTRRGITTTLALLSTAMGAQAAMIPPAGLAAEVAKVSLAKVVGGGGVTHFLWKTLFMSTKTKITLTAAAVAIIAAIPLTIQYREIAELNSQLAGKNPRAKTTDQPAGKSGVKAGDTLTALKNILAINDTLEMAQRLSALVHGLDADSIRPLLEYLVQMPAGKGGNYDLAQAMLIERFVRVDANGAVQWAGDIPNRLGRNGLLSKVFAAWANVNPGRALAQANQIGDPRLKQAVVGQIVQSLIVTNPQAALAALQNLPLNSIYTSIVRQAFGTWAGLAPQAAIAAALNLDGNRGRDAAVQSAIQGWASVDPAGLLEWANTLPENQRRNLAVNAAINVLSRLDPLQALKYVAGLNNVRTRNDLTIKVVGDWAQDDPRAAEAWALQNTVGQAQKQAMSAVINPLSKLDPQAAVDLLSKMPSGGGNRISAFQQITQNWADLDPQAALVWVKYLDNPSGAGPVSDVKSNMETDVIATWTRNNPEAAMAYVESLGPGDAMYTKLIATMATTRAIADVSAAVTWANAITDDGARNAALNNIITQAMNTEPQLAIKLAQQMPASPAQETIYGKIISTWSATDPAGAANSLNSLAGGTTLTSTTQTVAANWILADPSEAGKWINSLPTGEPRDVAAREEAKALTGVDNAAAFSWAVSIASDSIKSPQVRTIVQVWGRDNPAAATAAVQSATGLTELARTRMLALIQRLNSPDSPAVEP